MSHGLPVAGTTRIAADWRPRMSPPARSAASSAASNLPVSEPAAALNASSIAGQTSCDAMMLAWQETPSPLTVAGELDALLTGVCRHGAGAVDDRHLSRGGTGVGLQELRKRLRRPSTLV